MKKLFKKIYICTLITAFLCSLLAGCTGEEAVNTEQNSVSYVEGEDFQSFLDTLSAFAKADGGYYFLKDMLLYYFDTQTQEAYIVCSKPNCEHNSGDCTAFFSIFNFYPFQLAYYGGALYVLGWEEDGSIRHNYIYEVNTENYARKKAAYLFDGTNTSSVSFIIHRGYVYFLKGGTGELKETTSYLYRKMLGSTSKKEETPAIYEFSGIGAEIINIKATANNLIVLNSSYGDSDGNGYETSYYMIDIHSLETKEIVGNEAYSLFADRTDIYYSDGENTIYHINLTTNEKTVFCNTDSPCYISADGNYIYFDNRQAISIGKIAEENRKISVYDKNGNYITEITPKNPKDECYFGGDDFMFFKDVYAAETVTDSSTASSANVYYILDKAQLTSGNMQFIDME